MASQPQYVFTRDYIDNNRINLQHYQWIELFGYHLHPQIPTSGPELRVADVATGTGVWLTGLSTRLPPTVQLDGLDISLRALPPLEWMPSNVSFREWDIKQDVPEDLVGVYDIVHVRLLIFVLLDDEVPGILEKFMKLLKPGGYLQWDEVEFSAIRTETTRPDNKVDALNRLFKLSQSQDSRLAPEWAPNLAGLFESAGFCDIQAEKRMAPGHLAYAIHEGSLMLHDLVARATGNEAVAKGVEQLMPEVAAESKNGAMWTFPRWAVVGRKPKGL